MKHIKKHIIFYLTLLLTFPVVFSEIQLELPERTYYNLGESVLPAVSIKSEQNYLGFFRMHILCSSYNLQYYTMPLEVKSGFRMQMNVPELILATPIGGKCKLRADFDAMDGKRIDSKESEYFVVGTELKVNINSHLKAKPGEEIIIAGEVRNYNNELLPKGKAEINFGEEQYKAEIVLGKIEQRIKLDEPIAASSVPLHIKASDKYGNFGEITASFEILPIATRIVNQFESEVLLPGNKLRVKPTIFDQKNNVLVDRIVTVKVFDINNKLILKKDIESDSYFEFDIDNQEPGTYYLLSSFENMKEQSNFIIDALKKIDMRQENGVVSIKNVGNVDFNEEVTILLEANKKKYVVNKEIKLKPQEETTIDLSKEVPKGSYDITLPNEFTIANNINNVNGSVNGSILNSTENVSTKNIFSNVQVEDNRNTLKKTTGFIFAITGAIADGASYIASRPILATSILTLIILATVLHYSWGFLKGKVLGRKKDTENLFKDYKFNK